MVLYEINNTIASKDAVTKVTGQPPEWEQVFADHICDEDLASRMHEEFSQLNVQKTNN